MHYIFILCFLLKIVSAEDLETLLDEYKLETSKQIANKTKKESLGHIITFTQQDLEMMNIITLKDILKILPKVSMQRNFYGTANLTYAGNPNSISTSMRLYIDNQEVSSVQSLSPWLIYADYPMEHIGHIEVYYGESTLHLGNEPAKLTVKLYTKNPYTISGGILRTSISNKNSNSTTAVYANEIDNKSLLFMLSSSNINENFNNDSKNNYAHLSLKKDDYNLSAGFSEIKRDKFQSLVYNLNPSESNNTHTQYFLEFTKNFNKELGKIYFSYNQGEKVSTEQNHDGILVISPMQLDMLNLPKKIDEDLTFKKYDLGITNIFNFGDYSLYLGGAIKHKEYKVNNREIIYLDNSVEKNIFYSSLSSETIYSLLNEHAYNINESNILIANLKYDEYIKKKGFNNFNFLTSRLGYISFLDQNLNLKFFLTKTFTPPSMIEIDFATNENKDLKHENKNIATFEIAYEDEDENLSLFLNYLEIKNMIVFDYEKTGYINYDNKDFNAKGLSLNYQKYFNDYNKIHFNYYAYINSIKTYGSPKMGASIKAYQKFGNFNFYEELIYKQKYKYNNTIQIKDSYNLSLGIGYKFSQNFKIDFKVNNLLDDDMDIVYFNYSENSLNKLSNSSRKYLASLRWDF